MDPELEARMNGYSWDEIEQQQATLSEADLNHGYSPADVQEHYYGVGDPQPLLDSAGASFQGLDPEIAAALADGDAPDLTQNPGWRSDYANALMAGHAGGPRDFADTYAAGYVNAVGGENDDETLQRGAAGADDLAAQLPSKRGFTDAAIGLGGEDPSQNRDNLIQHWRDTGTEPTDAVLAAQNDQDLKDHLTRAPATDATPGWLDRFGSGILSSFAALGQNAIKALPTGFIGAIQGLDTALTGHVWHNDLTPEYADAFMAQREKTLKDQGYDGVAAWAGQVLPALPFFTTLGFEGLLGSAIGGATGGAAYVAAFDPTTSGDFWAQKAEQIIPGAIEGAGGALALHGLISGIGTLVSKMTPDAAGILERIVRSDTDPKVDVLNPGMDSPVTRVPSTEALKGVEPAVREPVVESETGGAPTGGGFPAEAEPAEKLAALAQEAGGHDDSPNFYETLAKDEDPKTQELAANHDASDGLWRILGNQFTGLMKDDTGAIPAPPFRTPQQIAAAADKFGQRNAGRNVVTKLFGDTAQATQNLQRLMNKLPMALAPHMDEWLGELDKINNPAVVAHPEDTVIGKFLAYAEGRSSGVKLDPNNPLAPWADVFRDINQSIDKRLRMQSVGKVGPKIAAELDRRRALPATDPDHLDYKSYMEQYEQRAQENGVIKYNGYIQDYLAHQVKDPVAAQNSLNAGTGKLGSRANLMQRQGPPTILDLVNSGSQLKNPNPFDLLTHDIGAKLHYSFAADAIDKMAEPGLGNLLRWTAQKLPGDVRFGTSFGEKLYVDADGNPQKTELWGHPALVKQFRHALDKGLYTNESGGPLYDKLLTVKNSLLQLKLGPTFFHAQVAGMGMMAGQFGRGLRTALGPLLGEGQANIRKGLWDMVTAPGAPFTEIAKARAALGGKTPLEAWASMTGDQRIKYITDQNFFQVKQPKYERARNQAPGLFQSMAAGRNLGEYAQDAVRGKGIFGTVWYELRDDFRSIKGDDKTNTDLARYVRMPDRAIGMAVKTAQRVLGAINGPLFDNYIPNAKAASAFLDLQRFMEMNPKATEDQIARRTRQITMDKDNRLGELNQENLFWPKLVKQIMNLSMVSPGWVYGTYRGTLQALQIPVEGHGFEWNPVALTNLIGTVAMFSLFGGTMNYLYTGKMPASIGDLLNFQTGGTVAGVNGAPWQDPKTGAIVAQRGMLPSELKEYYDIGTIIAKSWQMPGDALKSTVDYAMGKMNPMMQLLKALATGKDAVDHDIWRMPGGIKRFAEEQLKPIFLNAEEGKEKGTGLDFMSNLLGIRAAPRWVESWDRFQGENGKTGVSYVNAQATKAEINRARGELHKLQNTPWWAGEVPAKPGRPPSAYQQRLQQYELSGTGQFPQQSRLARVLDVMKSNQKMMQQPNYDPAQARMAGMDLAQRLRSMNTDSRQSSPGLAPDRPTPAQRAYQFANRYRTRGGIVNPDGNQ